MLPVDLLATMVKKNSGRHVWPKTVQQGKLQGTLYNFFRPKAPPIFDTSEPEAAAPAPAALVELEPELDPMLANAQWLLNLGGHVLDETVITVDEDIEDEPEVY